jgi:ACT domain-containing protein
MKAVLTVVGKDAVGILAKVSTECAKYNVNILDVTQSILQDMFCMIMIGDVDKLNVPFGEFSDAMAKMGDEINMSIRVMHEDLFNSMHRI